ncbi:MAG TPA: UDP-glucose 4-epimerase GalE [Dehalococcoidia bacterium]|nr:UDP-glucose 4-epimerase GalE [Dehalococcoidia bacterium]
MRVLVVGGAGYIGSVTAADLLSAGHEVVVFDSLVTGHAEAVWPGAELVVGDLADAELLDDVFGRRTFDGVVYYAGFIAAGESMREPGKYFLNNVGHLINLLNAMVKHQVLRFVFSSSAGVYGEPEMTPIEEDAPLAPVNPYGESKAIAERLLRWYDSQCDLRYVSLRYFNAAGATEALGEDHRPETHLIPVVLEVAAGKLPALELYGNDYPTPDGTCIRDYVHVSDLAQAHSLALERTRRGSAVYNVGNGQGFSNGEVVETARRITGHPIPVREAPRREGDPAVLVASAAKVKDEMRWEPAFPDLERIIQSAWRWHQAHPNGYES